MMLQRIRKPEPAATAAATTTTTTKTSTTTAAVVPPGGIPPPTTADAPPSRLEALLLRIKERPAQKKKRGPKITSYTPQNERRRANYAFDRDHPDAPARPMGRRPTQEPSRKKQRRMELAEEKVAVAQNSVVNMQDPAAQGRFVAAMSLPYAKRKLRGPLAKRIYTEEQMQAMNQKHKNSQAVCRMRMPKKLKTMVKQTLMQGLDKKEAAEVTGLGHAEMSRLWDDRSGPTVTREEPDPSGAKEDTSVEAIVDKMYVDFFLEHTEVLSGARRETRTLAIPKHDLLACLFGEFPSMLRKVLRSHGDVLTKAKAGTRLHKGLEAARAQGTVTNEQAEAECASRTKMMSAKYRQKLDKKRYTSCVIKPATAKSTVADDQYDKAAMERMKVMQPVGDETFWAIIKKARIKYTCNLKPTFCKICDEGPLQKGLWEKNLRKTAELTEDLGATKKEQEVLLKATTRDESKVVEVKNKVAQLGEELKKLAIERRKISKRRYKFKMHKEQLQHCRQEVKKIEAGLKVGECMLVRDFVCQYCWDGSKMSNLQLVLIFRCPKTGELLQMKISNFSHKESCDAYFVADVMDLHMKGKANGGSGLFDTFTKVYMVGDHGIHFSDIRTIFNESCMFSKYGKAVHVVSLCSYHAFNRCDAAGVHSKKLAFKEGKAGKPLTNAAEYTAAVNGDNRPDTVAFTFTEINRSVSVFGVQSLSVPQAGRYAAPSYPAAAESPEVAAPATQVSRSPPADSKQSPAAEAAQADPPPLETLSVGLAKPKGNRQTQASVLKLREMCEILYEFSDASGEVKRTPGVLN